ncbi:MAG: DUF481 domain-containing protein [Deltaproteobacteria bacterium]|jgi:hypothetical protein|nr:DUF481 domain-containing protein [Deltaproteobacteria bacterium]
MAGWVKKSIWSCFFLLLLATAARAAVLTLKNGDRLSGEIVSENEQGVTLRHPVLGVLRIPRAQLRTAGEAPAPVAAAKKKKPAGKSAAGSVKMEKKLPGILGTDFLAGWVKSFKIGISGEEGNDISMDFNAGLDISYHDQADRVALTSAYYYETDDRRKDTNKGYVNVIRDWLLPESEWFYYGYFRYEYDDFKSWEHRVSVSAGPGYDFYRDKGLELSGRIGLGGSRTWGTENSYDPEGLVGLEWNWQPRQFPQHKLSTQFILYPDLDDAGEYRTWAQGKWRITFADWQGFGIELGFEHEYESIIKDKLEDERHYDLIYFGRFGIDF